MVSMVRVHYVIYIRILTVAAEDDNDEFGGVWDNEDFTNDILQQILELENQALQGINEGTTCLFSVCAAYTFLYLVCPSIVRSELSTPTSTSTLPTPATNPGQLDRTTDNFHEERLTLQQLHEVAKASQTCMCNSALFPISNYLAVPFFTTRETLQVDLDQDDEDDPMVATNNDELPQTWQGEANIQKFEKGGTCFKLLISPFLC